MTPAAAPAETPFDRAAWAALAGTLAFAVALGGSGSATVRALVGTGVLIAVALLAAGMLERRRWRFPRGGWWLAPAVALALAAAQLLLPAPQNLAAVPRPAASWNPGVTAQAALWWTVVGAAMFAAASLVRNVGRLRGLTGMLAVAVAVSGAVGIVQHQAGNGDFLALWSAADQRRGEFLRDCADDATAWGVGPRGWEAWTASRLVGGEPGASRDKSLWFRPAPPPDFFGSFWSAAQWGGLALAFAPPLLMFARQYRRDAAGWQGGPERAQAVFCILAAAGLAFAGAWAGDPLAAPLAAAVGAVLVCRLARGGWRTGLGLALLSALPLAWCVARGDLPGLLAQRSHAFATQWAACRAHAWLGAGLGAGDDALSLFGAGSAGTAFRGSGWLAATLETGFPTMLILLAAVVVGCRAWRRQAPAMPAEVRQATGAVLAGLAAYAAYAMLAPGLASPMPLLAVAVAGAMVAPALAGRYRLAPVLVEEPR